MTTSLCLANNGPIHSATCGKSWLCRVWLLVVRSGESIPVLVLLVRAYNIILKVRHVTFDVFRAPHRQLFLQYRGRPSRSSHGEKVLVRPEGHPEIFCY
jgi:hypothetical protein